MKRRKISVVLVLLLSAIGMEAFAHNAEVNNLNEQPTTESMVIANTEFYYTNSDEVNGYACLADKKYHLHRELNDCINEYDKGINSLPYDAQFDLKSLVETHIVDNQAGTDQRIDEDLFSSMNLAYRFYPIDYTRDNRRSGPIETLFLTLTGKDELGYYNGIGYFNQVRVNIVEGKCVGEKIKGENPFGGEYALANLASTGRQPIVRVELYSKSNPEKVYAAGYLKLEISRPTYNNDIYYTFEGSQATVTYNNSNPYEGDIIIPETVTYGGTTYSVTSIGDGAFRRCSGLTSITIPNSVTSIGDDVFNGCSGLSSIIVESGNIVYDSRDECNAIIKTSTNTLIAGCKNTIIPNSVTSIGRLAFSQCSGLTSVTIPNSVTSIGDGAFAVCTGLTNITIPNSVTSLGDGAFEGCSGLTSVTIPNSVTSIGSGAFADCSGLTEVNFNATNCTMEGGAFNNCISLTTLNIGDNVQSIPSKAFAGCSSLTSVTIPNSVTSIGSGAFADCSGLTSITIPNSVTKIEVAAFAGCSGLSSIIVENGNVIFDSRGGCNAIIKTSTNTLITGCKNTIIPNSVTSIGKYAFGHCSGLTNITIPNSVTSIEEASFSGCEGLTSITIPNSMTRIGDGAFDGCSGLTSFTIPNSVTNIGNSAFGGCSGLTNVTIPNSVTNIGNYAFDHCSSLKSVTIPKSVTFIGRLAFFDCSSLTSVTMESMTPTEIERNTFTNRANAALYVPYGSKEAYKSAEFWKDFKEIVELEPDYNLSNKLVVSDVSVVQGGTVALPIAMENEDEITAFQFELELPNGITVSEATLTSRKSNQTLTYNLLDNGRYQFVAFSSNSQAFNGNEGALVNVLLKAGGTITPGNYTIEVKNIELTTTDEQACVPANCSATLTISNIMVGDANGDGKVSITDAVAVVNKLLGKPSANFRADAADVTGDGKITITDAVAIVNIVLGKRQANARMREPQ